MADTVEAGEGGDKAGSGDLGEDGSGGVLDFCREVEVLVRSGVFDEEFPVPGPGRGVVIRGEHV
ncbi:hypothetical protein ACR6C2_00635 [Streptomyces sp. INA 01156]